MEKMKLILNFWVITLTFLIVKCSDQSKIKKVKFGDHYISGDIKINGSDTVLDGQIKYFNLKDSLVSIVEYHHNVQNGKEVDYNNGRIVIRAANYENNEQNGITDNFDSAGNHFSRENYFHGLLAGPNIYYHKDSIDIYRFLSLENWEIYRSNFVNGVEVEKGSILNCLSHEIIQDNSKQIELFLYLLDLPYKKIRYSLYKKDLANNDSVLVQRLSAQDGFFKKINIDYPDKNFSYYLVVEETPLNQIIGRKIKSKVIEKEVALPNRDGSPGVTVAL
jgi:antitoxin component YwqK of YwqJK toxin-antitoxin module